MEEHVIFSYQWNTTLRMQYKSSVKKKGDNVLSGAIGPDNQGETGQLLYSGGKEEYIWNIDFLEHQIVVPWFVSIASGKLQSCASRL